MQEERAEKGEADPRKKRGCKVLCRGKKAHELGPRDKSRTDRSADDKKCPLQDIHMLSYVFFVQIMRKS